MSEGQSIQETQESSTPNGVDNPFTTFVTERLSRLEGLDLSGDAAIPNQVWESWNSGRGKSWFREDQEPPRTKVMTYDEIAKKTAGWKLHLNFDRSDSVKVQAVTSLLSALQEHDAVTTFKIGEADNQLGKEATVYVGHKDKVDIVASLIEEAISNILDDPEGKTLVDDIPFGQKVTGRFEVAHVDREFTHKGAKGHPLLDRDYKRSLDPKNDKSEARARAAALLRQRYGAFYTGKPQASAA
jgi:hypothetical protein